jgi:hypothetical protein
VPAGVLPDGPAQLVLVALAYLGHDVYAYQAHGETGQWFVWLGDLADVRPDRNGRLLASEWARDYAHLLAEFYSAPDPASPDGRLYADLFGGEGGAS